MDITPEELEDCLGKVSAELAVTEAAQRRDEDLSRLDRGRSALLQRHLEQEYLNTAQASCLLFVVCSNIQIVRELTEFGDAVAAVVKELKDVHRYQIQQKLQGGKLQIYCDEVDAPGVSLLTRWTGAALCPRQLARFGLKVEQLQEAVERQFCVLPRGKILSWAVPFRMRRSLQAPALC